MGREVRGVGGGAARCHGMLHVRNIRLSTIPNTLGNNLAPEPLRHRPPMSCFFIDMTQPGMS